MIVLLIVVGLVFYVVIGFLVARWQRPVTWARIRKEDPYYLEGIPDEVQDPDGKHRAELQAQVRDRTIINVFIWWWVLPVSLSTSALNKFVDRGDPVWEKKRLAEQLAERDREIAERDREAAAYKRYIRKLEQEAGIAGAGERHADEHGDHQRGDGLV
jgi:hypothetical protein